MGSQVRCRDRWLCILSPETLSILKLPSKKSHLVLFHPCFFSNDRLQSLRSFRIISIVRWVHGGPEWKAKNRYGENYARWILRWISRRRNLGWSPVKICEPQNRLVATCLMSSLAGIQHVCYVGSHTVDGCEIVHHLGWLKPTQNNGMFTTYQLVQDFAGPSRVWGNRVPRKRAPMSTTTPPSSLWMTRAGRSGFGVAPEKLEGFLRKVGIFKDEVMVKTMGFIWLYWFYRDIIYHLI